MKLLLVGDMHLRDDTPRCRTEPDYRETQLTKVRRVCDLAVEHDVGVVLQAGDFFHRWNPSLELCSELLDLKSEYYKEWIPWIGVQGQHDLPHHSSKELGKSGWWLMFEAGWFYSREWLDGQNECRFYFHSWGSVISDPPATPEAFNVVIAHQMVFQRDRLPFPGAVGETAEELLERLPNAGLILTGDNHHQFRTRSEDSGTWLINPGCLIRQHSDERDHVPTVYVFDTENPLSLAVYPVGAVPEHCGAAGEVSGPDPSGLGAFIEQAGAQPERVGLDFRRNVEDFMQQHQTPAPVREEAVKALEDNGNG